MICFFVYFMILNSSPIVWIKFFSLLDWLLMRLGFKFDAGADFFDAFRATMFEST